MHKWRASRLFSFLLQFLNSTLPLPRFLFYFLIKRKKSAKSFVAQLALSISWYFREGYLGFKSPHLLLPNYQRKREKYVWFALLDVIVVQYKEMVNRFCSHFSKFTYGMDGRCNLHTQTYKWNPLGVLSLSLSLTSSYQGLVKGKIKFRFHLFWHNRKYDFR